tara:strand:+ start:4072 stop:4569 length:498 start_codon:yes stop_codon:yes gene_type:complete
MTPWMHPKEIEFVTSQLQISDVMMEWGSGGSTTLFSNYVSKYYSVEHVKEWHTDVSNALKNYPILDVTYKYIAPDYPRTKPTQYREFKTYIEYPSTLNVKFDKVFIDGRARAQCAEFVLPYLKSDGIVFIHDYFARPQYHSIEKYYNIIGGVKDTQQTIVGLKKK